MSDGSKPPEKKFFLDHSFDPRTRTFRGTIDWKPLVFGGHNLWVYEMVFSHDYSIIDGGMVKMYRDEDEVTRHRFNHSIFYKAY